MAAIRILQFGPVDFSLQYQLADDCDWFYEPNISVPPETFYDIAILSRSVTEKEVEYLFENVQAYRLFYLDDVDLDESTAWIVSARKGAMLERQSLARFLSEEVKLYFGYSYGEKLLPKNMAISNTFSGNVVWNGYTETILEGDFGSTLSQVAHWRYNTPLTQTTLELWLEYEKTGSVEISLHITEFTMGNVCDIKNTWVFDEDALQHPVYIESDTSGHAFISLRASGKGTLKIVSLHERHSRRGKGFFLPGGERIVAKNGEEAFFYFDPADMKPPLNVYFSGYKTQEGFEGYYMMRKFGTPFLLVSDSRLEGGAFYMGSSEYEQLIVDKIRSYMDELGFGPDQVNFSGLSMGTYGALYYGCAIRPHAILLGKPLLSLGTMAEKERIERPGGFATSLDLVWSLYHGTDEEAVEKLNDRFWRRFDETVWENTKFIISYMYEDDYDSTAYQKILEHLTPANDSIRIKGKHDRRIPERTTPSNVLVNSKGLHGRHNDDTAGIVGWFKDQFDRLLEEDFGRSVG